MRLRIFSNPLPLGCLWLLGALQSSQAAVPAPLALQVNGLSGWVVTDDATPRLSWAPNGPLPGLEAWKVQVRRADVAATAREWVIPADQGPWLVLADMAFPSRARFQWSVEPILTQGAARAGRRVTGDFEVGLKSPADWHGQWIGIDEGIRGRSAPLFRKAFRVEKTVASARLYVCGLGWHEAWLNGRRLGDAVLEPAQTDYETRIFYVTHDVASALKPGGNMLGVWVGDGWFNQDRVWGPKGLSYGQPRVRAQLEIAYTDGSRAEVCSDGSWLASPSAVTATNVYQGEDYDARRFDPAWSAVGADAAGWVPAAVVAAPGGQMMAEELPPCRRMRFQAVKGWAEPRPGVFVADFGQNLTGWARLRVRATAGTQITLRFAESHLPDGSIDPLSTGVIHTKKVQTDTYICKGGGEETWEPRFTFHVFQYAELTVSGGTLRSELKGEGTLQGVAVYTDMPVRGEFACSDPVIQRMFELSDWTSAGNMQGLPSDCPGRERCGWTGDAALVDRFALHRFDSAAFWTKYQGDIVTSAGHAGPMLMFGKNFGERAVGFKPAGLPTMIAPGKRSSGAASPDWGSAIVFVPWDIYVLTGDTRILERNYALFGEWVEHLRAEAADDIVSSGLGDWCTPWRADSPRPSEPRDYYGRIVPQLSTASYWRSADTLARIAALLGHAADAQAYQRLADEIAAAFWRHFSDPATGGFGDQTVNAIAVHWGLLPADRRGPVSAVLARQIAAAGDHFYTGVFGLASLFPALGDYGHDATIARIFANPTAPGFRYLLSQGATTCWEVLPMPSDEGKPYERSKSHPFQGDWASWCYEGIGGIQVDEQAAGFRHFTLQPEMASSLEWARCREHTAMGWLESSWTRHGSTLHWIVEVPPGARATLKLPGRLLSARTLSGPDQAMARGARPGELSAGRYDLTVALAAADTRR